MEHADYQKTIIKLIEKGKDQGAALRVVCEEFLQEMVG